MEMGRRWDCIGKALSGRDEKQSNIASTNTKHTDDAILLYRKNKFRKFKKI